MAPRTDPKNNRWEPLLQTLLFTPATRLERFGKAAEVGADVLIIDLQDSVASRDKQTARANAIAAVPALSGTDVMCAVRINELDTAAGLNDVLALLESGVQPALVVVPKTESAFHIRLLDRLFAQSGCESKIIGLIESVRALKDIHEIAGSSSRLAALMLGAADLATDYGCEMHAPNLDAARLQLVQACTLTGISAIDSPFFAIDDTDGLRRAAKYAADMGFTGKAAIHPTQIEPIRRAFEPTTESMARARAILVANEKGVGLVDGQMVDEAVARRARQVLRAAART